MRYAISVILLLLISVVTTYSSAQQTGISSQGREYFIGCIPPSYNFFTSPEIKSFYGAYVLASSTIATTVRISYYDADGHESTPESYTISANGSIQVPLKLSMPLKQPKGDTIEYSSCHVVCNEPTTVEFFSKGACAGGSYLALPIQCWGKHYVVMSYHDNPGGNGGLTTHENSSGACEIIAAYDNTNVTITPVSTTRGGHPGIYCGKNAGGSSSKSYTITLKKGQTYTIYSAGLDPGCDLSGSTIISTKPVAVIAGHENALTDGSAVGSFNVEQRNYMIEQMLPVEMWDTMGYLSIPNIDAKGASGGNGD